MKSFRWTKQSRIDGRVKGFLNRPLTGEWPYLWPDAAELKMRKGGRIAPGPAIIAVTADTEGRREIIGMGIVHSEAENFWIEFPRSLKVRGLKGVRLASSDAHTRLKAANSVVAGIFSNEASNMRLIGAVPFEQNDEWLTAGRYVMVKAFAEIDKAEIDPVLRITTKAA